MVKVRTIDTLISFSCSAMEDLISASKALYDLGNSVELIELIRSG